MVERVGLLGWPLGHSVSPAMHNAAFAALGLNWHYDLYPHADGLADLFKRLLDDGVRGLNVTIPHKQAVLDLAVVTSHSDAVRAIGAANTLIRKDDGSLHAENTDWAGFTDDLHAHSIDPTGRACIVLGSGGSSKAVVYALKNGGAAAVHVVSRAPGPGQIGYAELPDLAGRIDLIVNCTPVGMSPHVENSPWPQGAPIPRHGAVYDLIYNPRQTRLMAQAEAQGAQAVGGLGMLIRQGAHAFELWTGQTPPIDVMTTAAEAALRP